MGGGGLEQGSPGWPGQRAPHRTAMRLLLLLCLAVPATRSSVKQEESVSPSMLAGEVPPTGAPGVRAPTHEPVSQLLVNFILLDGGPSGPWVKVSCWASSGSPPITYSLVGRDSGTFVLAVSTVAVLSTVAVISGRLSRARHLSFPDARHPHQVEEINFLMILRSRPPDLLAPQG